MHAHRLVYMLLVKRIPPQLDVLHTCDNPSCVNPKHLYLGTDTDNVADKVARGRTKARRGEASNMAKLRAEDIPIIRASTETHAALARLYGVSNVAIRYIRIRQNWKHIP
jgi:hypothetical protein